MRELRSFSVTVLLAIQMTLTVEGGALADFETIDLAAMSLEELMAVEVTLASRKRRNCSKSPRPSPSSPGRICAARG